MQEREEEKERLKQELEEARIKMEENQRALEVTIKQFVKSLFCSYQWLSNTE